MTINTKSGLSLILRQETANDYYNIYHEIDKERNAEYCMVRILEQDALDSVTGTTNYD